MVMMHALALSNAFGAMRCTIENGWVEMCMCDTCGGMPRRLSTMYQTIGHLSDMVHTLVENNTALQRTIHYQKGTIDSLEKHVKELVSVQMLQGSNSGAPIYKRNLIIGSSWLQDFDISKLIQSKVTCIRGGKIQDVHNNLKSNITTQYNRTSIVVGGNDCTSTADAASVDDLAESYRSWNTVVMFVSPPSDLGI